MRIPHSKPFLPPVSAFDKHVRDIWDAGWLTNHGPKVRAFEEKIAAYLGVEHVSYVSNGTIGLQLALRSLEPGGEVITTPYSYVATSSSVFWEGFKPVYADIESQSLSLNPANVEALIRPQTRAILATHVYGIPAQIEALEAIAKKHNVRLIFDAAHCFGVKYRDKDILSYGEYSILSLHATKLFHTANGGLVVSRTAEAKHKIDLFRNFGHNGPNNFDGPGINGKNSELNAALGLAMLPYADEIIAKRKAQWHMYRNQLASLGETHFLTIQEHTIHNGAYFPVIGLEPKLVHGILEALDAKGIEGRRYFNPSLNTVGYLKGAPCPLSEKIAETVFCLPLHHTLSSAQQAEISDIVMSCADRAD